jgi:hypothetical protein
MLCDTIKYSDISVQQTRNDCLLLLLVSAFEKSRNVNSLSLLMTQLIYSQRTVISVMYIKQEQFTCLSKYPGITILSELMIICRSVTNFYKIPSVVDKRKYKKQKYFNKVKFSSPHSILLHGILPLCETYSRVTFVHV